MIESQIGFKTECLLLLKMIDDDLVWLSILNHVYKIWNIIWIVKKLVHRIITHLF